MKQIGLPIFLCLTFTLIGAARGDVIHYHGYHPLPPGGHQGMCAIEGPHIHPYQPHKPILYVKAGTDWVFVGDPVEFEPKASKHVYYGHHPVFWDHQPGARVEIEHYCYITGPHHHLYAPPDQLEFKLKGGAYWYVGAYPVWYKQRRRQHQDVDRHYATVHLNRPVITVEPPSGYIGVIVGSQGGAVHGHVHGGVHVAPPSVQVNIPIPSLNVIIGGGSSVHGRPRVVGHEHHTYKYKNKHKYKSRGGPPGHAPAWGYRGDKGKGKKRK